MVLKLCSNYYSTFQLYYLSVGFDFCNVYHDDVDDDDDDDNYYVIDHIDRYLESMQNKKVAYRIAGNFGGGKFGKSSVICQALIAITF